MPFRLLIGISLCAVVESVLAQANVISSTLYFEGLPTRLSTHQYDQAGRVAASQYFSRIQDGSWGIHASDHLEYDQFGRETYKDQLTFTYSPDSLSSKTTTRTTYNEAGNVLLKTNETTFYITSVNPYLSKNKYESMYEYDPQGCLIKTINRYYYNEELTNEIIEDHETDASCRRIKTSNGNLITLWKYDGNDLVSERKYQVESDSILLEELLYVNNQLVKDFVLEQSLITHTYDGQGNQLESKTYYWQESDYLLTVISTRTYDEANRLVLELNVFGSDLLNPEAPQGYEEKHYSFNAMNKIDQLVSTIVLPDGEEYSGVTNYTYRCDGLLTEWVVGNTESPSQQRLVNIYSSPATCDGPVAQNFQLYPNPIIDQLTINAYLPFENATVKILSMSGQTMKILPDSKQFNPMQMDLSDLKPGIYLVRIQSGNHVYTQRIVKQ